MLALYKGELSYSEILNMTYKEVGYLRDLRIKRREKDGGASEAANAIASALTGAKI